jgi:hypothetical protein
MVAGLDAGQQAPRAVVVRCSPCFATFWLQKARALQLNDTPTTAK